MQEVVVIDYGMGNLHSVQKALSFLDAQPKLSQDAEEIRTAQKLILPGVGAFGDAMGIGTGHTSGCWKRHASDGNLLGHAAVV